MTAHVTPVPGSGVPAALDALRRGEPVLLRDADGNGEMLIAAGGVTPRTMAYLVRHTSGVACVAMQGERLDALEIPPQACDGPGRRGFAVSVDLRRDITTGISARDRAATARALADPATVPGDLVRPGHVLPVRVHAGGVLARPEPAEAGVDLCGLAGLAPAAVLAAVEADPAAGLDGSLVTVAVCDVVRFREVAESPVRPGVTVTLPTAHGEFRVTGFLGSDDGAEHLALVRGDPAAPGPVLVRVHGECVVGDVLGSRRCGCSAELTAALEAIDRAGRGVLVYLRGRRGPGMGLTHALSACRPRDPRDDRVAAHVLRELGVRAVAVLTGGTEPADLAGYGLTEAPRVPLGGAAPTGAGTRAG